MWKRLLLLLLVWLVPSCFSFALTKEEEQLVEMLEMKLNGLEMNLNALEKENEILKKNLTQVKENWMNAMKLSEEAMNGLTIANDSLKRVEKLLNDYEKERLAKNIEVWILRVLVITGVVYVLLSM